MAKLSFDERMRRKRRKEDKQIQEMRISSVKLTAKRIGIALRNGECSDAKHFLARMREDVTRWSEPDVYGPVPKAMRRMTAAIEKIQHRVEKCQK